MIACIWARNFRIFCSLEKEEGGGPFILLDSKIPPSRVVECSPSAREAGVEIGMPERLARTRCPEGVYLVQNLPREEEAKDRFLEVLDGFSPKVEWAFPGLIFIDLGPFTHQEKSSHEGLMIYSALLQDPGFSVRVGIGPNRFVSRIAALFSFPGKAIVVPPGKEREFLYSCPITLLPLCEKTITRLQMLGFHTLGELKDIPAQKLILQFGEEGEILCRLREGVDSSPIQVRKRPTLPSRRRLFETPATNSQVLLDFLDADLESLYNELQHMRKRCCRMHLQLFVENQGIKTFTFRFSAPQGKTPDFLRIARSRIKALFFQNPVQGCEIILEGLVPALYLQEGFVGRRQRNHDRLRKMALQLQEKGLSLMQVDLRDPHCRIPERRAVLKGFSDCAGEIPLYTPSRVRMREKGSISLVKAGKKEERIQRVLEKWVVEEDWWELKALSRVYYRVLLDNGAIYKLFYDQVKQRWYRQPGF